MTLRAVILGLLLGLLVSAVTYFNDAVINQTQLIGNFLPIAVFGVLVVLLLAVNPTLGAVGTRWRLKSSELVVITAIGLAACGWPGSGFFRTFTTNLAMPSQLIRNRTGWQDAQIMSYVPGGSPHLARGHVRDWEALVERLAAAEAAEDETDRLVWTLLPEGARRIAGERPDDARLSDAEESALLRAINENVIEDRAFYTALGDRLPEVAEALLEERAELAVQREDLGDRLRELEARRTSLRVRLEPEREALIAEREPLRLQREALARQLADLQARLRKAEGPGGEPAPAAEAPSDLTSRIEALRREIEALDARMAPLEARIRDVTGRLAAYDNPIRLLQERIDSIDHRIGTANQVGRLEAEINRIALEAAWPELLAPYDPDEGPLLAGGTIDPFAVETLQQGWRGGTGERFGLGLADLPWRTWWPTLKLWGGLALLVGTAALCLTLIVHPQWSQRELLAYPIARFVEEVTRPAAESRTPAVLLSRLFWYGLLALVLLHLVNGLNKWDNETFFIKVPTQVDFTPLKKLFPTAKKVYDWQGVWNPTIYLSVVAFAFFLNKGVSFSLGISGVAYVAFGTILVARGTAMVSPYFDAKNVNLMVFGAYLGMAGVLLYIGRRYYLNVLGSAFGLSRRRDTPPYATWAARGLIVCLVLAVLLLCRAGLDWPLSILAIALVMLTLLIITRINVETGAFFLQAYWLPATVLVAVLGHSAISPQAYVLLALASVILVGDPREAIMPYLANGLRMGHSGAGARPRRLAPWLLVMLVAAFVAALLVTLWFQYNLGVNHRDKWATVSLPREVFNSIEKHIVELRARGDLARATATSGLGALAEARFDPEVMGWVGLGLALVVGVSIARLRISWWFIHPVMFLVWGTKPGFELAASFFLGWAIKTAVVKLGGAKGYQLIKPLMVGVIAGELLAAIGWAIVGAVYFALTGKAPVTYSLLPG